MSLLPILFSHDGSKDLRYVSEKGYRYPRSLCIRTLLHSYFDGEPYHL